jgi:hypothetical protein
MSSIIYLHSDWTENITFREPEFANTEEHDFNQAWGTTEGGQVFVEDPGFKTITYNWNFLNLRDTEKVTFQDFFEDTLNNGKEPISIRLPNRNTALIEKYIFCDMVYNESYLTCDQQISGSYLKFDEKLPPDYYFITNVKIIGGRLPWKDATDGWWDLPLTLVKEPD